MARKCLLAADRLQSPHTTMTSSGRTPVAYTPYGLRPAPKGASITGFTGQLREFELGCYLLGNGHRVFSPSLMRFFSADVMSPFGGGGVNSYAYCQGDPINRNDPSGNIPNFIVTAAGNTPGLVVLGVNVVKSVVTRQLPSAVDWVVDTATGTVAALGMNAARMQYNAASSSPDGSGQDSLANDMADWTTVINAGIATVVAVGAGYWVIKKGGVKKVIQILSDDISPPPSPGLSMVTGGELTEGQKLIAANNKAISRRQSRMETFGGPPSGGGVGQALMGNSVQASGDEIRNGNKAK